MHRGRRGCVAHAYYHGSHRGLLLLCHSLPSSPRLPMAYCLMWNLEEPRQLCHIPWLEKGTHVHPVHREPRVFWEDTRPPVERGCECRAKHTYTLATALSPHTYVRTYAHTYALQARYTIPWYVRVDVRTRVYVPVIPWYYTCTIPYGTTGTRTSRYMGCCEK